MAKKNSSLANVINAQAKQHPNRTVVAAERVVEKIVQSVIHRNMAYNTFSLTNANEEADVACRELEQKVLIDMVNRAETGNDKVRTSAQNIALTIAKSYAVSQRSEKEDAMMARMRANGIKYGLHAIEGLIARAEELRRSCQEELASVEECAATDEEYEAFRMAKE